MPWLLRRCRDCFHVLRDVEALNPIFGGTPSPTGPPNYLGMSVAEPIATLGVATPSRALGTSWKRAALIDATEITLTFPWALFGSGSTALALFAAVLTPVATWWAC